MKAQILANKEGRLLLSITAENDCEKVLVRLFKLQTGTSSCRENKWSDLQIVKGSAEIDPFHKGFYVR